MLEILNLAVCWGLLVLFLASIVFSYVDGEPYFIVPLIGMAIWSIFSMAIGVLTQTEQVVDTFSEPKIVKIEELAIAKAVLPDGHVKDIDFYKNEVVGVKQVNKVEFKHKWLLWDQKSTGYQVIYNEK